jgi:hypothetical protein
MHSEAGNMQQEAMATPVRWAEYAGQFMGDLTTGALLWALLFGFLGLVAAIAATFLIARKRWLYRELRVWNALAKLSYVVVFFGLVFAGSAAGAVYGAQRHVHKVLSTEVRPAIEAHMPAYREYVGTALSGYLPDQFITPRELVEPYIKVHYYVPASTSSWERTKARIANEIMLRYAAEAFTERFQGVMSVQLELLGEKRKVAALSAGGEPARFTAEQLRNVFVGTSKNADFTKLDATVPQIIVDALDEKLSASVKSMYQSIALALLALLLVVSVEMLIYSGYRKRWGRVARTV